MSKRTLSRTGGTEVECWLAGETREYFSVLEFGSGLGAYTRTIPCPVRHGIEAFEPYVRAAREDTVNQGAFFIHGDMRHYRWFITYPYDVALFIDSLEHVTKEDGLALLRDCQTDFNRIAVFVPIGFRENEVCDGNELQLHLSSWERDDFLPLGFSFRDFHPGDPSVAVATWTRP